MAALERSTVQVPGHRFTTTVWRGGTGQPLVFLHGAGGLSPKDPTLTRLAERFEVIAPVHPGFENLEDLDELEDVRDLALYHDDLLEVLDLKGASVIGHSFGGMVAAELAAHVPARVAKLVLIGPVGLWRDEDPVADLLSPSPSDLPALLWSDPNGPAAAAAAEAAADPDADPVEQLLAVNRAITASHKYLWPIPNHGLGRRLYRVKARTLILWGADDRMVPASYGKDFAGGIAGSRLEIFERAGHLLTAEQPGSIEVIEAFLVG
jgi:pimeloyl-ACP methyl ester carboxylesterase